MNTILRILPYLSLSLIFFSCTDVIDVDVPTGQPRLVVEASIDWEKGTAGNQQTVKLSMLTPYYNNEEVDEVIGAQVSIKNEVSGDTFVFEDQNDGTYAISTFIPVLNNMYTLDVKYKGMTYKAEETMMPVSDIEYIDQSKEGGSSSEDLEVNLHFQDPINEDNFYLFRFHRIGDILPHIEPISDEFTDGNLMEESFEKTDDEDTDKKEELKQGDIIKYEMHGVSERYYNYMQILVNQLGSGGLFNAVPVELKGNCINVDNPKDFTLGYFRLTESIKGEYIVK